MHELSWRTVSVLTWVLFWSLFPSLLCNAGNKHQNNPLVSAETVRHSSTCILYISTAHLRYCTLTLTHRYTLSQYLVHFTIFFNLEFHLWVYMMYLTVFSLRLTLAYLSRIPYVIIRGTIPQVVRHKLLWKHALLNNTRICTNINLLVRSAFPSVICVTQATALRIVTSVILRQHTYWWGDARGILTLDCHVRT